MVDVIKANKDNYFDDDLQSCNNPITFLFKNEYSINYHLRNITKKVGNDLAKVEFDCENVDFVREPRGNEGLGLRTLPNGLSLLGVRAGGDWEVPIYFIIYWDGKELRGYIPVDGNPWNTDKKCAYGNEDTAIDDKNCKKRFGIDNHDYAECDWEKIDADIMKRITKG